MKLFVLVLLLSASVFAQRLQDVPPADQKAIQTVILSQVEAFKKDDAVKAFSFAAPNIRSVFETPERFVEMVKTSYIEIYRPLTVEFGKAIRSSGAVSQQVTFLGQDSKKVQAVYLMQKQADGNWKIAGVQMQETDGPGTI